MIKRRYGIMGGTFDPIHNAHLIIGSYALEQYALNGVVFMTGGNPPHKKTGTSAQTRYEMTKLAVGDTPRFSVSDYEVKKEEYSYTLETMRYLTEQNPDTEYYFIIGEDSLDSINTWYKPEEILKLCKILVFPRIGGESKLCEKADNAMKRLGGEILVIDAPIFELSSSEIRERVHEGKSIRYMLPEPVRKFIEENNLYK